MGFRTWSKSELEYRCKVLNSGLEGARLGQEAFLNGKTFNGFLSESLQKTLQLAALGACIAVLSSRPGVQKRSVGKMLALGLIGGAIGFGASFAWESRHLAASAACGASRNIDRVRDERWMEKNSIAYA